MFRATEVYLYYAYAQRLAPLFIYITVLSLQLALFITWNHRANLQQIIRSESAIFKSWLLTFVGVVLLVVLITISRLGLDADPIGWGKPTVPLMEWQIWLGVLISLISRLFAHSRLFNSISRFRQNHKTIFGIILSTIIWGAAFLLWMSLPVPPGFFATPPRPPNFEIYPFSDAAFYDFHAQSLLIGLGFRGESIPPRPLYILFLAAAHLVAGQDYNLVILVQTFILAFFPVIVFWIGKRLANTTLGVVAAFFVILREWTSILSTPFTSDISNSKLLFADLPAALVISLLMLIVLIWLDKPRSLSLALTTGGILGISLLVRTQIIILLPVILVFLWLVSKKIKIKYLILPIVFFFFGCALVIAPWLYRNYRITGQIVFDHPESQTRVMAQRYSPDTELTSLDRNPDESTGEYNQRLSTFIRQQMISHPMYLAQFISAHWVNSEISNLLIFPIRFSIQNPLEIVVPQHPFWEEWNGSFSVGHFLIFLLNLSVLTFGVVYLVRQRSWAGLLPLAFNAAYHFSNAAARNSGWRYLLPADWIFLLYFAGGIFFLTHIGTNQLSELPQISPIDEPQIRAKWKNLGLIAGFLVFIGSLPLLAESAFPRVYPPATIETVSRTLAQIDSPIAGAENENIKNLLMDPNVKVLQGLMLYPRYYDANSGEEKTGKTGYAPLPYSRYVFLIAGEPEGTIIFPHTTPDLPLKNAKTALVIGCMDGLAVRASIVVVPTITPGVFISEPTSNWSCQKNQ